MYVIPLIVLIILALGIFFSPIFAVLLLVVFLIGLGIFKFLGPGTEPEHAPRPSQMSPPAQAPGGQSTISGQREEDEGGLWGETWPEQRSGEDPS